MQDNFRESFREEAKELLTKLENLLLALEKDHTDANLIGQVFRILHTIKGTSAMFGFEEVSSFTHRVENLIEQARDAKLVLQPHTLELLFQARDQLLAMIEVEFGGAAPSPGHQERLETQLGSLLDGQPPAQPEAEPSRLFRETSPGGSSGTGEPVTYRIRFKPPEDLLLRGGNPCLIFRELSELADLLAVTQTAPLPDLRSLEPDHCYCDWLIYLTTTAERNAIRDIFIFVENDSRLEISQIEDSGEEAARLGEILIQQGTLSEQELTRFLAAQKKIGERLVEEKLASEGEIEAALRQQRYLKELQATRSRERTFSSIRVQADKLDKLVDMVSELVTLRVQLNRTAAQLADPRISQLSEAMERVIGRLHDEMLQVRMLPIGTLFGKFKRLVRELSRQLGKEAQLVTTGDSTELDKHVIEKLNDPLVHLIRNCLDHGLETPQLRQAAGKPATGTISLEAEYSGGKVCLSVSDDGAGLDPQKILATAKAKGLVPQESRPDEQEIYKLIFLPGFSTRPEVSTVSGRGVGMDVVKKTIDALGGFIEVRSRPGQGSCINLQIPLTLSLIEGLLVETGQEVYIIPLQDVSECIELPAEIPLTSAAGGLIDLRGEALPCLSLRQVLQLPAAAGAHQTAVVVETPAGRVGLAVDRVIGEQQVVIKGLGRMYRDVDCIFGATILGDGRVTLILDLNHIVERIKKRSFTESMPEAAR